MELHSCLFYEEERDLLAIAKFLFSFARNVRAYTVMNIMQVCL